MATAFKGEQLAWWAINRLSEACRLEKAGRGVEAANMLAEALELERKAAQWGGSAAMAGLLHNEQHDNYWTREIECWLDEASNEERKWGRTTGMAEFALRIALGAERIYRFSRW